MDRTKSRTARKKGPGRMHSQPEKKRNDKLLAIEHGISEPLRRRAKRYGIDVITLAQTRLKADLLLSSRKDVS